MDQTYDQDLLLFVISIGMTDYEKAYEAERRVRRHGEAVTRRYIRELAKLVSIDHRHDDLLFLLVHASPMMRQEAMIQTLTADDLKEFMNEL